jgi:Tol biopolymer transport system component
MLVFPDTVGGQKLWSKTRDKTEAVPISGTDGALNAFFSPDGNWIGFVSEGKVKKIPISGGAAITLADSANTNYVAGAWQDDGTILYATSSVQLMRVPADGGTPEKATSIPASRGVVAIQPLPKSKAALISVCTAGCGQVAIWVAEFGVDSARLLMEGATNAWYLPSGQLLHTRSDGGVLVAPFDLARLELSGAGLPVLEGIRVAFGQADMAVSTRSGTVLYSTGIADGSGDAWEPVWVDRSGRPTPVDPGWRLTPGSNTGLKLSPDGTRLAINILTSGTSDTWIKQLDRGPLSRLTFDGERNFRPMWTPDGKSVTFLSNRGDDPSYDLYEQRADGSAEAKKILNLEARITEGFWSPDGQWLVMRLGGIAGAVGGRDVVGFRPGVDTVSVPLISDPRYDAKVIALSPDGKWLAYESTESSREEIFVRPFPNTSDAKVQISTNGGLSPVWGRHAKALYFLNGAAELVEVPWSVSGADFQVGERKVLFPTAGRFQYSGNSREYDIHPDGSRFLFLGRIQASTDGGARLDDLVLIEHWYPELKATLSGRQP